MLNNITIVFEMHQIREKHLDPSLNKHRILF